MTAMFRTFIAGCMLACLAGPAGAQELTGTLKKAKDSGSFTIGFRDASVPLSYLDDKAQPIGFSIELCRRVVEAVKSRIGRADLKVAMNPVNSATRIPLVANGTVDIECGSTPNQLSRPKQARLPSPPSLTHLKPLTPP